MQNFLNNMQSMMVRVLVKFVWRHAFGFCALLHRLVIIFGFAGWLISMKIESLDGLMNWLLLFLACPVLVFRVFPSGVKDAPMERCE